MAKLNERDLEKELARNLYEALNETVKNWELEAGEPYLEQGYSIRKVEKLVARVAKYGSPHIPPSLIFENLKTRGMRK